MAAPTTARPQPPPRTAAARPRSEGCRHLVELGEGGIERWIVYPIVLWPVAFGSYLLGARREGTR